MATIESLQAEIVALKNENTALYQKNASLRSEHIELLEMVESFRQKIKKLLEHIPAHGLPAPTTFGTLPSVEAEAHSHDWIVLTPPLLHRTFANLSPTGRWVYWEEMEDGRFKWNPKYVEDNE